MSQKIVFYNIASLIDNITDLWEIFSNFCKWKFDEQTKILNKSTIIKKLCFEKKARGK